MEITKQTTIGEILTYDEDIAYVLADCGMFCVGCPSSIGESLEEACGVHGLAVEEVLAAIRDYEAVKGEKLTQLREKFSVNV